MRWSSRWRYLRQWPRLAARIAFGTGYDYTFDLLPMHVPQMPPRRRLNLLRAGLNLAYRRCHPWSWPIHLKAELTNYCNLRCPVCPVGSGDMTREPMNMDMGLFEQLMEEVGPYILRATLFVWGEPLLHPDFARAVSITRRHGVIPVFSTNGQNLNEPSVREALIEEPADYLIVALDGMTDETNAQYRLGARVAPALEGVRWLADEKKRTGRRRPVLVLRFIVMKHNEHEVSLLPRFAKDNGFDMLSLRYLAVRDMDQTEFEARVPQSEQFRGYRYRDGVRVRGEHYVCQHAFLFPAVLADGTVVACDDDYNGAHPYGRVGVDGSFRDIWFGERAAAVRRKIRHERPTFAFCRNCPAADRPDSVGSARVWDFRRSAQPRGPGREDW
jgi:MoaA/NifB/PqqE/SkfB family radical SAM enzyme